MERAAGGVFRSPEAQPMSADDKTASPLQFDTAIPQGRPAGDGTDSVRCASCERAIPDEYFDVGGQTVCRPCADQIAQQAQSPQGWGAAARAGLYGVAAMIAGAILYYAVVAITEFEIGIVAIAIGYMVGYAVRAGAGSRGGRRFQVMAVLLTYWAVGLAYIPIALTLGGEDEPAATSTTGASAAETSAAGPPEPATVAPAAEGEDGAETPPTTAAIVATLAWLSFSLPLFVIIESMPGGLISAAIIAFGMLQAWQMTAAHEAQVTGPYRIGAGPTALT
jgi:hypothetical protein